MDVQDVDAGTWRITAMRYRRLPAVTWPSAVVAILATGALMASQAQGARTAASTQASLPTVVSTIIFDPPIEIVPGEWLVRLYGVGNVLGFGRLMYVPCVVISNSSSVPTSSELSKYRCTVQRIPTGPYKGRFIDQHGHIITKPQGAF
jgi:hypothetical protein